MPSKFGPHRQNFNHAGHAHELTFCCYRRYPFLNSDRTCTWLAESLNAARDEQDFDLWAYVFMPEHVHLLIHPRKETYDIAKIRQAVKEPVARRAIAHIRENSPEWLPRVSQTQGNRVRYHFWQKGGGFDANETRLSTLVTMIDYIHANPVRRRLVDQAEDWK